MTTATATGGVPARRHRGRTAAADVAGRPPRGRGAGAARPPRSSPSAGDVVDIGCGPIGILPLLSERVGPYGLVTGLDRHAEMLDHAADTCRGSATSRVAIGDATATGLPRRSYDLAHIRLLLVDVPDPAAVLREAAAIVRPSGTVAVQEVDWLSWQCEPALPEWTALRDAAAAALALPRPRPVHRAAPADAAAGGRAPGGLAVAHAGIDSTGQPYQRLLLTFAERSRRRLLEDGVTSRGRARRARRRRGDPPRPPGHGRRASDDGAGVGPGARPRRGCGVERRAPWSTTGNPRPSIAFAALSDVFDEWTRRRLLAVGLGAGWSCWEVGAGGPRLPAWLAEQVGPGGRVVATDLDVSWLPRDAPVRGATPRRGRRSGPGGRLRPRPRPARAEPRPATAPRRCGAWRRPCDRAVGSSSRTSTCRSNLAPAPTRRRTTRTGANRVRAGIIELLARRRRRPGARPHAAQAPRRARPARTSAPRPTPRWPSPATRALERANIAAAARRPRRPRARRRRGSPHRGARRRPGRDRQPAARDGVGPPRPWTDNAPAGGGGVGAGERGLEPLITEPESAVLPATPLPTERPRV